MFMTQRSKGKFEDIFKILENYCSVLPLLSDTNSQPGGSFRTLPSQLGWVFNQEFSQVKIFVRDIIDNKIHQPTLLLLFSTSLKENNHFKDMCMFGPADLLHLRSLIAFVTWLPLFYRLCSFCLWSILASNLLLQQLGCSCTWKVLDCIKYEREVLVFV